MKACKILVLLLHNTILFWKILVILPKVQVASYSWIHDMHPMCVFQIKWHCKLVTVINHCTVSVVYGDGDFRQFYAIAVLWLHEGEQGWLCHRVTDLGSEGFGFESQQENFILQGQLSVLNLILVSGFKVRRGFFHGRVCDAHFWNGMCWNINEMHLSWLLALHWQLDVWAISQYPKHFISCSVFVSVKKKKKRLKERRKKRLILKKTKNKKTTTFVDLTVINLLKLFQM